MTNGIVAGDIFNYIYQYENAYTTNGSPVSLRYMEVFALRCIVIIYALILYKRIV